MRLDAARDHGRIEALDIARGLGMILVIYGHALQIFFHKRADGEFSQIAFAQWQAIYSFHMPLFFLVSGAILDQFAGKSWKAMATRSVYFVVLAYAIDVIGILFAAATQGASSAPTLETYLEDHLLLAETFSTITLWFLVAFAIVRLVACALIRSEGVKRWALVALLAIVFAASYRWPQAFHLRAVPPGVAFFMLGRYLAMREIKPGLSIALPLLATAVWLAHYNGGCTLPWQTSCENAELPGRFAVLMIFGLYGSLPLFALTAAIGSIGILGMSSRLAGTWISSPLRYIGRNTLGVLIIDGFFLVFANPLLRDRVPIDEAPSFFVMAAALAVVSHILVLLLIRRPLALVENAAQHVARAITHAVWSLFERRSRALRPDT